MGLSGARQAAVGVQHAARAGMGRGAFWAAVAARAAGAGR